MKGHLRGVDARRVRFLARGPPGLRRHGAPPTARGLALLHLRGALVWLPGGFHGAPSQNEDDHNDDDDDDDDDGNKETTPWYPPWRRCFFVVAGRRQHQHLKYYQARMTGIGGGCLFLDK